MIQLDMIYIYIYIFVYRRDSVNLEHSGSFEAGGSCHLEGTRYLGNRFSV